MAVAMQQQEIAAAKSTILKNAEKSACLRSGRSEAAFQHGLAKGKKTVGGSSDEGYVLDEDVGIVAERIFKKESQLESEQTNRATRSGHGYH